MSLKEASKNISLFSKLLQPIIEAGPELERIGNLEEYEKLLTNDIETLKKNQKTITDNLAIERLNLNKEITTHNEQVKKDQEEIEVNRKASDDYKKQKEKDAKQIISNANNTAQLTIRNAEDAAKKIVIDAQVNIKDKLTELDAANGQLASVNAAIAARNTILNELNKKLGALQN